MLRWYLGHFEQADRTLVIDESTTLSGNMLIGEGRYLGPSSHLDVSLSFVGDFHDELGFRVDHVLQNRLVDTGMLFRTVMQMYEKYVHGTQVIGIGYEKILLAFGDQLIKYARMEQCVEQVTVTGRVPVLLVVIGALGAGEQALLVEARVARLIEGGDSDLLIGVLLDDTKSVLMCVERGHQNKRDISALSCVEVFNLAHSKIEEGHVIFNLERALRTSHTCRSTMGSE